jgi:hypothetical protein
MNIPRILIAALLILAATAVWYWGFRSSEEDRIRTRLNELAEVISNPPSEGLLGKAKVISSFQKLLANPVILETQYYAARGIRSPKELAAGYLGLLQSGQTITLSFDSPSINFPSENEAKLKTTISASLSRAGQTERTESGTLFITLGKNDQNDWVFERFSENP